MSRRTATAILCLMLLVSGCRGSRWARSDPAYAAKYPRHSDSLKQMAKQAVDARHLAGQDGYYLGGAGRDDPFAAGAQVGYFLYPPKAKGMVETHAGLAGLVVEGDQGISGGFDLGVRLQSPSRFAPFVGVGGYAGFVPDALVGDDGRDNNGNGFIDESGEDNSEFVGAAYPEVGAHFWLTPRCRVTASASHYFTTLNDQSDFTLYGLSLAWLYGQEKSSKTPTAAVQPTVTDSAPIGELIRSTPWTPPSEPIANNPYSALLNNAEPKSNASVQRH